MMNEDEAVEIRVGQTFRTISWFSLEKHPPTHKALLVASEWNKEYTVVQN